MTDLSDRPDIVIDPEEPGLFSDPGYFDLLHRLRHEAPVHRYKPHAWTVAGYDDVRAVSRDPERFSSAHGVLMNDPARTGASMPGSIIHMDPPLHGPWRRLGSRWFTPRAVAILEEQVRAVAHSVLDPLSPGDRIDVVDDVSAPIPVLVIAELLGIGDAIERTIFRRWSDACIGQADGGSHAQLSAEQIAAGTELFTFLGEQVVERRATPRDDLITTLIESEVEGVPLRDIEVVMYCLALLVAGNETTRHLISGTVAALFDHPDQRRSLVGADRDTLATAVEECLRWVTPIQAFGRTATVDLTLGDAPIEAGDWVVLLYASANRDEAVYGPTAGRFDVHRPADAAHVAFGFGEHLCLGASLARMEARVFLELFLDRFPEYVVPTAGTLGPSTLVRGHIALEAVL